METLWTLFRIRNLYASIFLNYVALFARVYSVSVHYISIGIYVCYTGIYIYMYKRLFKGRAFPWRRLKFIRRSVYLLKIPQPPFFFCLRRALSLKTKIIGCTFSPHMYKYSIFVLFMVHIYIRSILLLQSIIYSIQSHHRYEFIEIKEVFQRCKYTSNCLIFNPCEALN
jgi:hypothetical protein